MKVERNYYFFKRLKEKHIPLHVQIELTTQCNNDCVHCIREKNTKGELDTVQIKRILSQLKDAGCMQLTFTGGEPLLRQDFFDICSFARSKGFMLKLLTNATLIDNFVAKQLKRLKFKEIIITLFSLKEETHDLITHNPGSFKKTIKAIDILKRNKVPFYISAVIMKDNIYDIKGLKDKAKENKWQFSCDPIIYPTYSGSRRPLLNRLSGSEIEYARREQLLNCGRYDNISSKWNELTYFYLANLHCYISSDGRIFPHATIRLESGDLRKNSFKEIWKNSPKLNWLRNLRIDDFECFECSSFLSCPWNLGLSLSEHGKITARPQEYCRLSGYNQGGEVK